MKKNQYKYTDEQIIDAVKESSCVIDVMRILGSPVTSGGCHRHISARIKKLGLNKSSFGKRMVRISRRRTPEEIFVLRPEGSVRDQKLASALESVGVKKICSECGINTWLEKPIVLDVDHIDGNPLNNVIENLRFLCPNCHSQTTTFRNKKR